MTTRSVALALAALFAFTTLPVGLARAQEKKKASNPWVPTNVKRIVAILDGVQGFNARFHTPEGAPFKLFAVHSGVMLFKHRRIAQAKEFEEGDRLVVYYNVPPEGGMKLLWAAMDPPSEILLVELRSQPVAATFKSFDAATSKLTVQVNGRPKTYTVVARVMALRQMKEAVLGKSDPDKNSYSPGDKVLLIMTADRKRVRMVMDQASYDKIIKALKKFPVPPASKIPKK